MLEAFRFHPKLYRLSRGPMPRWKLPRWKLVTSVGLLLVFPSVGLSAESGDDYVRFTFSADPGEVVLSVSYRGGMDILKPAYTVYGDGRFEYRLESIRGRVYERYDYFLDYSEVAELLQLVVDHNLPTASEENIEEQLRARTPNHQLPRVTDGSDMTLQVVFTSYAVDGEERGPLHIDLCLHAPSFLARSFEIEELKGMAAIALRMRELGILARARREEKNK